MAVLVPYDGGIACSGLRMRIDEAKKPDPEPCSKVVCSLSDYFSVRCSDQAIVAGRTGGGLKVFSKFPGYRFEVPPGLPGEEDVSVLAFIIDIPGRDIRFKVALSTGKRFSCNLNGEGVSWMTG